MIDEAEGQAPEEESHDKTGDEPAGEQKLDSYILANLTGQIVLSDKWQLNARIENLLDKAYETVAGYRMQELSGFLELKYIWE